MSLVTVNRLLTFIFFSLCKIPIINSDLRDQTVNNVLILAYFQVMYYTVLETYGGLILSLTNTSKSTREGLSSVLGKEAINSSTPRVPSTIASFLHVLVNTAFFFCIRVCFVCVFFFFQPKEMSLSNPSLRTASEAEQKIKRLH